MSRVPMLHAPDNDAVSEALKVGLTVRFSSERHRRATVAPRRGCHVAWVVLGPKHSRLDIGHQRRV
jgi:hypothetical protein